MLRTAASILSALTGLVLLTGCDTAESSDDVNPDRVWTRYELIYDGTADRTESRASFRFGNATGTQLRLDGDVRVAFNGRVLDLRTPLDLTFYNATLPGYTESGVFRYTNADGRDFESTVRLRPATLPRTLEPVRRGQDYTVRWAGEPIGANEEVRVVLYRVSLDTRLAVASAAQVGATTVTIPAEQTQPIGPGGITVLLTRFSRGAPDEPTEAGGETVAEFNAPQRLVEVVD